MMTVPNRTESRTSVSVVALRVNGVTKTKDCSELNVTPNRGRLCDLTYMGITGRTF